MRIKATAAFIVLLFITYSKENNVTTSVNAILPSGDALIIGPYNVPH